MAAGPPIEVQVNTSTDETPTVTIEMRVKISGEWVTADMIALAATQLASAMATGLHRSGEEPA